MISVIIAEYDMCAFLPAALESIRSQNYGELELLVIHDGLPEVNGAEQMRFDEFPVKVFEVPHGGKAVAINKGLREATGDYIAILDADDRLPPNSLNKRVKTMQTRKADLCLGSFEVWYDDERRSVRVLGDLREKDGKELIRLLLSRPFAPFHQNAMMFSRDLLERTGGMNPAMKRGQDIDFAVRLLEESDETVLTNDSVYRYCRYDRSLIRRIRNRLVGTWCKLRIICRIFRGGRAVLYGFWGLILGILKLIYNLFGIYKR